MTKVTQGERVRVVVAAAMLGDEPGSFLSVVLAVRSIYTFLILSICRRRSPKQGMVFMFDNLPQPTPPAEASLPNAATNISDGVNLDAKRDVTIG